MRQEKQLQQGLVPAFADGLVEEFAAYAGVPLLVARPGGAGEGAGRSGDSGVEEPAGSAEGTDGGGVRAAECPARGTPV